MLVAYATIAKYDVWLFARRNDRSSPIAELFSSTVASGTFQKSSLALISSTPPVTLSKSHFGAKLIIILRHVCQGTCVATPETQNRSACCAFAAPDSAIITPLRDFHYFGYKSTPPPPPPRASPSPVGLRSEN